MLDWKWRVGDRPGLDPLERWDLMDDFLASLPDTSWRRRNLGFGINYGGRVLEGFRVYRGEASANHEPSYALLAQYDVIDELHYSYDTGLRYTFVDSNLTPGKTYWYAVTSFSIPKWQVYRDTTRDSTIMNEIESLRESSPLMNTTRVTIANEYQLYQAYPNPFNSLTTITFDLPARGDVSLRVYDVLGREVVRLVDEFQFPGRYRVSWNAANIASGVYFYKLIAESFSDVKKMLLIK